MAAIRQIGGVLLLILAALKMIGMVFLLIQGSPDREPMWFVKQTVYAIAAASVGVWLLRSRTTVATERDKQVDDPQNENQAAP